MDKKNFTLFLAILAVMVVLVGTDMLGSDKTIAKVGKPEVKPPFGDDDYTLTINDEGIMIELSPDVAGQYNGEFLSVYAYDDEGNHISKLKRVVDGRIFIDKEEAPSFRASFLDGAVSLVDKADKETSFYQILKSAKDSRDNDRHYGLGRCLLGMQCSKICPVAAIEVLVKDPSPQGKGRIIPDIDYDKCIQGGLCAVRCPTNLIVVGEAIENCMCEGNKANDGDCTKCTDCTGDCPEKKDIMSIKMLGDQI